MIHINTEKIVILKGADGIRQAYRETLKAGALDIVCLSQKYDAVLGGFFEGEYAPVLYGPDITTREILPDTPENRAAADKKGNKHEVRLLAGAAHSESDMVISADRVTLVSFDPAAPFAAIITDRGLVASLKMQFDALWGHLKV
ncbi:hypothetical protein A2Z33_01915 [Candidatus Gottesmanbacteria bacterium RBG_16_52_11]|uniref:Uncharacterized protein n=1 Tax=Candidatus Gottesmanbacteria bacterium RBG_16_52_11 TaxID=1798374 RepID=A0A1F5YRM8_9BACT|nr:MAG: hypothetical protein A2Z33_01915 [Candidatus Gottesmanbacteria bacterium RBG_16_52_11]